MRRRPFRSLCALTGALLIGTVGLGLPAATAAPVPAAPPAAPAPAEPGAPEVPEPLSSERVSVVVLLKDQPSTLSTSAESSRLSAQEALIATWAEEYELEVDRRFGYLVNGFSATLPGDEISALSLEPEVSSVRRERVYERTEHTARTLEGVPGAFADHGVDGTGMVISIIDSGLDPSHQDMRLDDCDAAAIQEINPAPEAGFTCKIPTGYNYADESYEVTDGVVDAHGQHVGGIAAANGSEGEEPGDFAETGRIDGVAPNAQLLAMKVFSNSGGGASDSDIVAAIEDSVKLDADVINMSLGSPNGQKNTSDATSVAIEKARDAGVMSVIAAGNDGQNFSATAIDDDALGYLDDGTVGAPGTQGSAFTVASMDNSVLTQLMAYVDGAEDGIPYSPATGEHDGLDHELVDIGLGTEADVEGLELDGAYALIQRGDIPFADKYAHAVEAGAGGVVVFNSEEGGDTSFGMAGVEDSALPGITLGHSAGAALQEQVAAGTTTIRITDEVAVLPSPSALTPSSFTSWGTTPTLDFEPEIAGIGGNVYSTYNGSSYGMSSGTSMASPNVAGLSALVLEHLEEIRPEVTGAERVDLAKIMLMNTAMIPADAEGVPYAPRQVGAGLAQVDTALDSSVIATVEGGGAAALREIDGSAGFTVTLTNSGEEAATFEIPQVDVLAESNEPGTPTTVRVSEGTAAISRASVTVPAGGTASVDVTVAPEAGADHFAQGWVRFTSGSDVQPDLAVPFLGFSGDWNAEEIINPVGEELIPGTGLSTGLIGSFGGQTVPLSSDLGEFWLSPNGDGDMDVLAPNLVVMRNASDISYEILTESGDSVRALGQEQGLYRSLLSDYTAVPDPRELQWTGASFDGTLYDPQEVDYTALPDGRYMYQVRTRLGEDQPWQTTQLPFGIDATAPEVEFGAYEGGLLPFTITEEGSGILDAPTVTDAAGSAIPVVEGEDGTYSVQVDPEQVPYLTVSVLDGGFNLAVGTKVFSEGSLVIPDAEELAGSVLGPQSMLVSDGELLLSGYVSSDITAVRVGEQSVETAEGRFRIPVALSEGAQEFTVEGLDAEGGVAASQVVPVTYDSVAPELEITSMETDAAGSAVLDEDGSVQIAGIVSDEREGAELSISADGRTAQVASDGSFELTVTPGEEATGFALTVSDGVNTDATAVAISGRVPAGTWALPEITNADCTLESGACFVPGDTPDVNADGSVFTLRGEYPAGGTIALTPGSRAGDDGQYVDGEPITAQIGEDGAFSAEIPVATGENHLRMVITDTEGEVRYDRGVRLYFDVTAPTLEVEQPTLTGGTLYTREEQITVAGTAEDDGWGYALALNDSVALERFDLGSPGADSNRRDFSTDITVADGDTLLIEFSDSNGNVLLGLIPVVLDTAGPTLTLEDLAEDEHVDDGREIEILAEDPNLASLQVILDDTVFYEESTELSSHEHSVQDALVDLRDLDLPDGAAENEAENEAEEEAPEVDLQTFGLRTAAAAESLGTTLDTAELEHGEHELIVVSTDLAGNVNAEARSFSVGAALEITGPDSVEQAIHREQLGDQEALAALVLGAYEVTAGGEAAMALEAGAELSLAPHTVLREGEQTVTLLARDEAGRSIEREITVAISLKQVTLSDGEVTATSTFRSDDTLSASLAAQGASRLLTLSNRAEFASLDSVITLPGAEGETVVRVLHNGTEIPVAATWAEGTLTFEGPSQGTYRTTPAGAGEGGGDGGSDGVPAPGEDGPGAQLPGGAGGQGAGDGQDSGRGSGDSGDGQPGASGPLARTGADLAVPLAAVVALLLGGVALSVLHRRS